eukprot:m.286078 g.286078  ORF g.286078 m.286078 type:complete len:370 (+) comp40689_c0_seq21:1806-2915(+)
MWQGLCNVTVFPGFPVWSVRVKIIGRCVCHVENVTLIGHNLYFDLSTCQRISCDHALQGFLIRYGAKQSSLTSNAPIHLSASERNTSLDFSPCSTLLFVEIQMLGQNSTKRTLHLFNISNSTDEIDYFRDAQDVYASIREQVRVLTVGNNLTLDELQKLCFRASKLPFRSLAVNEIAIGFFGSKFVQNGLSQFKNLLQTSCQALNSTDVQALGFKNVSFLCPRGTSTTETPTSTSSNDLPIIIVPVLVVLAAVVVFLCFYFRGNICAQNEDVRDSEDEAARNGHAIVASTRSESGNIEVVEILEEHKGILLRVEEDVGKLLAQTIRNGYNHGHSEDEGPEREPQGSYSEPPFFQTTCNGMIEMAASGEQ